MPPSSPSSPRLSRRTFLWALAGGAPGRPDVVVEDWRGVAVGSHGIPSGWQRYETPGGHPAYDFSVIETQGRRALHMVSDGDHPTIVKEVTIDLGTTPRFEWEWRILAFAAGADLRQRATADATGHLFLVWPRFPAFARSRLIGYIWDPAVPVGTIIRSPKSPLATFIVVRSGHQERGAWVGEQRDVVADHRAIFGEPPAAGPGAVALSIDTNDTRSRAEAQFGRIAFTTERAPRT
jgi:hypothetical protein